MTAPKRKPSGEVRERTRREKAIGWAWMFGSLFVSVLIITGLMALTDALVGEHLMGLAVAAIVAVDLLVFQWGARKFDITPPKEFREATEADK